MNRSRMIVFLALWLAGCSTGPSMTPATMPAGTLLIDVSVGENHLEVYGYGEPPRILKLGKVYGTGLSANITNRRGGLVYKGDWGEATSGCIIDYSQAAGGVFRFTDCTQGYCSNDDYVGLIETTVSIRSDGTFDISRRIVLEGEKADKKTAEQLVQKGLRTLEVNDNESEGQLLDLLLHLRNMGINDPDMALGALRTLSKKTDGHYSEMVSDFTDEVERIKKIKGKQ